MNACQSVRPLTWLAVLDHSDVDDKGQGAKDMPSGTLLLDSVKPSITLSALKRGLMPHKDTHSQIHTSFPLTLTSMLSK